MIAIQVEPRYVSVY